MSQGSPRKRGTGSSGYMGHETIVFFRLSFSKNSFSCSLSFLVLGRQDTFDFNLPKARSGTPAISNRCTNRTPEADLRYPIWDLVPILGQLARPPSFPRQFVTEKESVTVYLTDRSIVRCRQSKGSPGKLLSLSLSLFVASKGLPINCSFSSRASILFSPLV